MKTLVRQPKKVVIKKVSAAPSKPIKTGLKKSDPEYFKKIGLISAKRRRETGMITHEQLSNWAKKSHTVKRDYSKGGYRRESRLKKQLEAATASAGAPLRPS